MKCPRCEAWTELLETRKRSAGTYRRYECANMHRFSTMDSVVIRVDETIRSPGRPRKTHLNEENDRCPPSTSSTSLS